MGYTMVSKFLTNTACLFCCFSAALGYNINIDAFPKATKRRPTPFTPGVGEPKVCKICRRIVVPKTGLKALYINTSADYLKKANPWIDLDSFVFTQFMRKEHHCKRCGWTVCNEHSKNTLNRKRACDTCFEPYQRNEDEKKPLPEWDLVNLRW